MAKQKTLPEYCATLTDEQIADLLQPSAIGADLRMQFLVTEAEVAAALIAERDSRAIDKA